MEWAPIIPWNTHTKTRGGRQPGHALRYAKGFARGLLHHGVGHYPLWRRDTVVRRERRRAAS